MEIKIGPGNVKEVSDKGEGVAVIATLNVVDHDGDVTLPGAFGEGQVAMMVPAHDWAASPIGKATIHESGDDVLAEFKINRQSSLGKDWYEALKFDVENPPSKQEYSYGFKITDSSEGVFNREGMAPVDVRFIKGVDVAEVSPVLKGAGINTRTLAIKSKLEKGVVDMDADPMTLQEHLKFLCEQSEEVLKRIADVEGKRLLGSDRREEMVALARLHGDIKAALEAPLPEEMVLRMLARQMAFRQARVDNRISMV